MTRSIHPLTGLILFLASAGLLSVMSCSSVPTPARSTEAPTASERTGSAEVATARPAPASVSALADPHRPSVLDEVKDLPLNGNFQRVVAAFEKPGVEASLLPEERVVYGAALMSQGRYQEARLQYQKVLQAQPNNPDALRVMALYSRIDGNLQQQLAYLNRWVQALPQDPEPLAALGWAHLEANRPGEARRSFEDSLRLGRTALALAGMGQLLFDEGKFNEALGRVEEALELEPDNDAWHALRHQVLIKVERPQEAERAITRAINLNPENPWHLLDRARLRHRTLYKSDQALEDLNRLLQLDPENFFGLVYRAEILENQGRLEESYRDYAGAHRIKPEYDPIYPSMALLSFLFDDFTTAARMSEESFKQHPGEWAFPVIQSLSLRQLRRQEEANRVLNQASRNFQNQPLIQELFRFVSNPRANFALNSLLERESNEVTRLRVRFYVGYVTRVNGQAQSARAIFRDIGESRLRNIPEIAMARVLAARP